LHLAALHNQAHVIDYLLKQEVDVFTDLLGLSPLDYAKKANNPEIISKLDQKGNGLNGNSD
jgi:ankyrin repeat protein